MLHCLSSCSYIYYDGGQGRIALESSVSNPPKLHSPAKCIVLAPIFVIPCVPLRKDGGRRAGLHTRVAGRKLGATARLVIYHGQLCQRRRREQCKRAGALQRRRTNTAHGSAMFEPVLNVPAVRTGVRAWPLKYFRR